MDGFFSFVIAEFLYYYIDFLKEDMIFEHIF